MDKEKFLRFVAQAEWTFAKTVPNWPHFYIVEKNLPDQAAFQAAKAFVRESGRLGKFFDMDVFYFDADEWTYWASPLAKPPESQYMLNRCKTEYSYEACARSGELPPEGFRESKLSLSPILEDPGFRSLMREEFTVFDVLGTSDYEIRHSNVLSWLVDRNGNHGQGALFLDLLWKRISDEHPLPSLSFREYSVVREGENESERIDLFIKAEDSEWVIVIENKIFSPETGDQLDRYFKYVESHYAPVPHRFYFYLTPEGLAPAKDENSSSWIPISYSIVKKVVMEFLESMPPGRVKSFLEQYVEHIEKNVLKNAGLIEKQRSILKRHAKIFHSLAFLLDEEYIHGKCSEVEFNVLKSILAVQKDVGRELFLFTKQMLTKHGYSRYSGLGHWITIEPPRLRGKLIQSGLAIEGESLPIVFAFDSLPDSYVVKIWVYKNRSLYSKHKERLPRFSPERPEPNRGDEHLVAVMYQKTIISSDQIVRESLEDLKNRITVYFDSDLEKDLEEWVGKIEKTLDSIAGLGAGACEKGDTNGVL